MKFPLRCHCVASTHLNNTSNFPDTHTVITQLLPTDPPNQSRQSRQNSLNSTTATPKKSQSTKTKLTTFPKSQTVKRQYSEFNDILSDDETHHMLEVLLPCYPSNRMGNDNSLTVPSTNNNGSGNNNTNNNNNTGNNNTNTLGVNNSNNNNSSNNKNSNNTHLHSNNGGHDRQRNSNRSDLENQNNNVGHDSNALNKHVSLEPIEERPTYEEVVSWATSFDILMANKGGQKIFAEFLKSEFSDENILFWQACEELKNEVNGEKIEEKARIIYEDFISILSPKEVSLDSRVREIINTNMVHPSLHTFDEAQTQIYTLMQRDSYPRFVGCAAYKKLLQSYSQFEEL